MSRSPATRAFKKGRPRRSRCRSPWRPSLSARGRPHLPWWHTPNGELRDHKTRRRRSDGKLIRYSPTGQKLKAMGAKRGVPDLTFIMPNGQGAFLELKRADDGEALRRPDHVPRPGACARLRLRGR
jgi:hypothetical protein